MSGTTRLSEQTTGSNGWAIEELLERGLGRLIEDLRELEASGFDNAICLQVQEALHRLVNGSNVTSGATFAPIIVNECDRFRQRYIEWNNFGTQVEKPADIGTRAARRGLISKLFDERAKMLGELRARRKGFLGFITDDDFAMVKNVYDQLEVIVSNHPNTFFRLEKSVTAFKTAVKERTSRLGTAP